jgi:hypothetical protein
MRTKWLGMITAGLLLIGAACEKSNSSEPTAPSAAVTTTGPHTIGTSFTMPMRVRASLSATGCDNSPGPQVTLSGGMTLGGLGIDVTFRNNDKGTHTYTDDTHADATLLPAGGDVTIPKQPVLGGTGGNPFISVQFVDGNGNAMTDEIYLGRCVQGPVAVSADFSQLATALAEYAVTDCSNNPGPFITLNGGVTLGPGVKARIIFRNNDNPVGGPHQNSQSMQDIGILEAGHAIQFPKQPVLGGVGGNPWILAQFQDDAQQPIGDQVMLGRCVQLSQ